MKDERREVARFEPKRSFEGRLKTSLPVRVVDISTRGAQLELERSLRPEVTCEVRFPLADREVAVVSTVRRCRAWGYGVNDRGERVLLYRAGVEFAGGQPEEVRALLVGAVGGTAARQAIQEDAGRVLLDIGSGDVLAPVKPE